MDAFTESYQVWATLSGANGHWDLGECLALLHRIIGRPLRLFWPAPYGQPVTLTTEDFDAHNPYLQRHRIISAVFPEIAPELIIQSPPHYASEVPSAVLEALSERWRKVWWESIQSLDQVWNTLWLSIHGGQNNPGALLSFLTQGAETIVRAPVILLAARKTGYQVLEITHARGLVHSRVDQHPVPIVRGGLGGFVAENQESVVISDYDTSSWRDAHESALIHSENLRGGMAVPWQATDGLYGVMYAWFHEPGAPSPLALYAFQRYVRSIRAVVLSAQSASPYSYAASLARFTEDSVSQSLLRLLRLARRHGSWETLLPALAEQGIWIQLTDAWGHLLRKSPDIPDRSPARTVALDGLETTMLTIWGESPKRVEKIYPYLVQTIGILVNTEATLHDTRSQQLQEWFARLNQILPEEREQIWNERKIYGLDQPIAQIWGIRISQNQALTLSGRALMRAIRRQFGIQPITEGRTIWAWATRPLLPDDVDTFRRQLMTRLGQPLYAAGIGVDSEASVVIAAMTRIKATLSDAERLSPEGITRSLGRPRADQLFRIPGVDTSLQLFTDAWIGPLLRHDEENGTEFVTTLAVYLASPSLSQAARSLFVHPNTIRYRLGQITRILAPLDLQDPDTRATLLIAARCSGSVHLPILDIN